MPTFSPFPGVRYNPRVDLEAATSPPYDVISPEERTRLAGGHPANAVHVDLPDEADGPGRYEAAAAALAWMLEEGVLVADNEPAFYVYRMDYVDEAGRPRRSTGVLGALELSRPGEGAILPHEHTTPKAKSDRLDLLRATRCNTSAIWGLTAAPLTHLCPTDDPADGEATDEEGVRHRLWRLTEPAAVDAIAAAVASGPVVVADGHHRYETSLAYRDERRAVDGPGPWDATLAFVVELTEDELAVRAIHRLLRGVDAGLAAGLEPWFDVVAVDGPGAAVAAVDAGEGLALVLADGTARVLRPRSGAFPAELADLDSARLALALERLSPDGGIDVEYQHGTATVLRRVAAGEADAGVLLRPASVAQIRAIAEGGERMPPKTTFFWPKPRTGFVFRPLDERQG